MAVKQGNIKDTGGHLRQTQFVKEGFLEFPLERQELAS